MNSEVIILYNFLIYIFGFILLFVVKRVVLKDFSDWIVLGVHILGIIFASSIQDNFGEYSSLSFEWIKVGNLQINYDILLNNQSYFLYVLVQAISLLVVLFASKYLREDKSINRFYAYICLFVAAMMGLILAGNLVQFYMFWELVGFASFLLIGFWYGRKEPNKAAFKAFMINKLGDCFLLLGIFMIYFLFKDFRFETLTLEKAQSVDQLNLSIACVLIFGGVMSKSAQIPMQSWLVSAMQGPTPASALIHAATMVVSGVYLLGRINPILPDNIRFFIACVGAVTCVVAGISAIFQNDIKKVLAFSTISQLGIMVAAMGIGAVGAAFFHLATHAFFKAGLFLGAGAIIDYSNHQQDMRKMGNLTKKHPFLFSAYCILAAALIGIPFTSGFLSKESIFNACLNYMGNDYFSYKIIIPALLFVGSFLTSFYVVRMVVMAFFERQENPVNKIISATKKTVEGALKSFENVLTGEKQADIDSNYFESVKNAGVYEISTGVLAISSLFFVFSKSPFSDTEVWFLNVFNDSATNHTYFWLPSVLLALFFVALLISYNTTFEELRSYYLEKRARKKFQKAFRIASAQFYIEDFIKGIFKKTLFNYNFDSNTTARFGIFTKVLLQIETRLFDSSIKYISSGFVYCANGFTYFERNIIDKIINVFTEGIFSIAHKIKNVQKGQMQIFIMSLLIGILFIFFLIII